MQQLVDTAAMRRLGTWLLFVCCCSALYCCSALHAESLSGQQPASAPSIPYTVVARYPHDSNNFTQGLEIAAGALFESSGLYGHSFIARQAWPPVDSSANPSANPSNNPPMPTTPTERQPLPARYFGEGLTVWGTKIYVVTWREQQGFIFDRQSLKKIGEFGLQGEGWGLTHNDRQLILSDGSPVLRFLDPESFALEKTLTVTLDGAPLAELNELEWIEQREGRPARLLANIWQSDTIVAIDPATGHVTGKLDCSALYPLGQRAPHADVLNGIALDADDTLLVTGKFWPHIYRLKLLQALP